MQTETNHFYNCLGDHQRHVIKRKKNINSIRLFGASLNERRRAFLRRSHGRSIADACRCCYCRSVAEDLVTNNNLSFTDRDLANRGGERRWRSGDSIRLPTNVARLQLPDLTTYVG